MDAGIVQSGRPATFQEGAAAVSGRDTSEMLRENFMTLLVAQLQNQDPLNPLENSELTSHLAQINTVGGIDALNKTLTGITTQIEAGHSLQAAALIGKGVLVPGTRVLVGDEGAATPFGVELDAPAAELRVRIAGADGQVLREFVLENVPTGVQPISWDGETSAGEIAPPGAYQLSVEARNQAGELLAPGVLNFAIVNAVSSTARDGLRLDLGAVAGQVKLEDVRLIL